MNSQATLSSARVGERDRAQHNQSSEFHTDDNDINVTLKRRRSNSFLGKRRGNDYTQNRQQEQTEAETNRQWIHFSIQLI
jgi:hypothetical protein